MSFQFGMFKDANGPMEYMEAIDLQNQVVMLMQSGQHAKAKPLAKRSIELRIKTTGKDSVQSATAYLTMGQLEMEEGNYEKAFEWCKKSAAIRECDSGSKHDAACSRDDAARCLEGMGRLKEARQFRMGGPDGKQGIVCGSTPCSMFAPDYRKYKICGRCNAVWYCSKPCQTNDWKRHKQFCKPQAS